MEKLIELLNEFEDYNKNCEWGKQYNYYSYRKRYEGDFERDLTENCMNIVFIISKTFGFIKWLVDNDKIDRKKAHEKIKELGKDYWWFDIYSWIVENCLLMLLAIQDEPIEFLISILK